MDLSWEWRPGLICSYFSCQGWWLATYWEPKHLPDSINSKGLCTDSNSIVCESHHDIPRQDTAMAHHSKMAIYLIGSCILDSPASPVFNIQIPRIIQRRNKEIYQKSVSFLLVITVNDNNVFHHQTSLQFEHAWSGLRQRKIKPEIKCLQRILSPHIK